MINVTNSIVVKGSYSIELLKQDGASFYIEGAYLKLEKPSLIEFTLRYRGVTPAPPESVVTMKLESPTSGATQLNLKQVFELEPADMPLRTKAWEHMLAVLGSLVASN